MVHACAAYGCNNRYQEDLPWCRIEKITWKFYITKPSVSGSINVYVKPDYNLYMHTHSCVFISFTAATTLPNLFTCHQFFGRCWDHQLTFADFAGTNNEVNKVHPVVHPPKRPTGFVVADCSSSCSTCRTLTFKFQWGTKVLLRTKGLSWDVRRPCHRWVRPGECVRRWRCAERRVKVTSTLNFRL